MEIYPNRIQLDMIDSTGVTCKYVHIALLSKNIFKKYLIIIIFILGVGGSDHINNISLFLKIILNLQYHISLLLYKDYNKKKQNYNYIPFNKKK